MKMHANARLSLKGRELLIERVGDAGWSLSAAAEAAGISDRTARKWVARHRAEGRDGLLDRSSAPSVVANRTDDRRVEVITQTGHDHQPAPGASQRRVPAPRHNHPSMRGSARRGINEGSSNSPGKPGALLRRAPLRTVRAAFTAHGSSKPQSLSGGQNRL